MILTLGGCVGGLGLFLNSLVISKFWGINMQYQLVAQFPEKLINLNFLVEIENDLEGLLVSDEVDGHDVGSGDANIFIITNKPEDTFQNLKPYLIDKKLINFVKIAYRRTDEGKLIILYPDSLKEFRLT